MYRIIRFYAMPRLLIINEIGYRMPMQGLSV
jgi:hypothetical protein